MSQTDTIPLGLQDPDVPNRYNTTRPTRLSLTTKLCYTETSLLDRSSKLSTTTHVTTPWRWSSLPGRVWQAGWLAGWETGRQASRRVGLVGKQAAGPSVVGQASRQDELWIGREVERQAGRVMDW